MRHLIAAALLCACTSGCTGDVVLTVPPTSPTTSVVTGTAGRATNVFDGDSFEALAAATPIEVRLVDMNAPEGDECHGEASRDALVDLLADRDIIFVPSIQTAERDQFGRFLVNVWVEGVDINGRLVARGDAVAMGGRSGRYAVVGQQAIAGGLGMWAVDACGPAPPPIAIDAIDYDPDGPDDQVMNEESVTIVSGSDGSVGLGGWTLRDESTSNRYVFPAGTILESGARLVVHTGCGQDVPGDLHWCSDNPVWSNGGDTAILQDGNGTVAATAGYPG